MSVNFNQNLDALRQGLNSNQYFTVKNGHLAIKSKATLFQKIVYFFRYFAEIKKVREMIRNTIVQITPDTISKEDLRSLFLGKMAKLSKNIFDRSSISKSVILILEPELEKTKKGNAYPHESLRKLDRRIKKTELAINLGIELKRIGKGNSGSYFALDYKGKSIGVFKPRHEESLGSQTPKFLVRIRNLILRCIFGIDASSSFWKHEGYLAECMTSKVAEWMGFKTVPFSKVVALKSSAFRHLRKDTAREEKGSFQYFIKNAQSMDTKLGIYSQFPIFGPFLFKLNMWRCKDKLSEKIDQEQFEEMAVLDYITCNRDRHFANLLTTASSKNKNIDIHLIDHEWSFPRINPRKSDKLYRINQYKWAALPQAEFSFSEKIRRKIDGNLRGEKLFQLIDQLTHLNDLHGQGFNKVEAGSSQALAFKKRVAVLLIAVEKGMTLKQLALIKSSEDIEKFLSKNGIRKDNIEEFLKVTNNES